MGATKERYQNPVAGDLINLRLFTYNSNNLTNLASVDQVDIYFMDPELKCASNPDGLRLVDTFDGTSVTDVDTGTYLLPLQTDFPKYVIGTYTDQWTVRGELDQPSNVIKNYFKLYPNLWYSTPIPVVYDFQFSFQPNKLRKGSKQYLIIEIIPNVPTAGELRQYYENLAIVSDLKISIEQVCGNCLPKEKDLRMIVECASVDYREKRFGFYQLDTCEMECGIYDVWFKLEFGGNIYLSDRQKLQIFD